MKTRKTGRKPARKKAPVSLARRVRADVVGAAVKRWCRSPAAYKVLDRTAGSGGTWKAGGCVVLAYALESLLPGARVVGLLHPTVFPNLFNFVLAHVGVLWCGVVIDADGAHPSMETWAERFSETEGVEVFANDANAIAALPPQPTPKDGWELAAKDGWELVAKALQPVVLNAVRRRA